MNIVNNTKVFSNRFEVEITDAMKDYTKESFYYEVEDMDISEIPIEILQIPFILNILPVVWLSGLKLSIDSIDKNFYESIKVLQKVFQSMYPQVKFDGELSSENIVDIKFQTNNNSATLLFSGGLDSLTSMYRHIDENLILVSLQGADIQLEDKKAWSRVHNLVDGYLEHNKNLSTCFINSNFKTFLNHKKIKTICSLEWWGNVQHGMGMISFMSIPAYIYGASVGYIASGYSNKFKDVSWGSAPKIDNNTYWSNFKAIHDSFDMNRQDKVNFIVKYKAQHNIFIKPRVCFSSIGAMNCCKCGKCVITISGLLAANANYKDYGFDIEENEFIRSVKSSMKENKFRSFSSLLSISLWKEIQDDIKSIEEYNHSKELLEYLTWFKNFDFDKQHEIQKKVAARKRFFRNIEKKIVSVFRGK